MISLNVCHLKNNDKKLENLKTCLLFGGQKLLGIGQFSNFGNTEINFGKFREKAKKRKIANISIRESFFISITFLIFKRISVRSSKT